MNFRAVGNISKNKKRRLPVALRNCETANREDALDISQESVSPIEIGSLSQQVENYEKSLLESVLRNSTSLRDAGSKLGVNASTISRKIKQYGIDYPGKK